MTGDTWRLRYDRELERARLAREAGNEGMARVCARRAAGILAGEFLLRGGRPVARQSAYDRLKQLQSLGELSPQVRQTAGYFLLRVDSEHMLPADIDLILEASRLREQLVAEDPGLLD